MNSLPVLSQEIQPQANPLVNVFNTMIDGVNQLAVNARDLHKFLKVGRDFSNWIKSRISQYIFVENVDYIIVENLSSPNRANAKSRCQKMTDYHLTLDMAKELAMVENNEEGRKVRRYFIRCEKDLYKSGSQQREVLRQACESLATGNMLVSEAYVLVGKHFGYEGGIKDIPSPLLPEAIAFTYQMIIRLHKTEPNFADGEATAKLIEAVMRQNTEMQDVWDGLKYINKKEFGRWSNLIVRTNELAEKLSNKLSPKYATPKINELKKCIVFGNGETRQINLNWFNYPA